MPGKSDIISRHMMRIAPKRQTKKETNTDLEIIRKS